MVDLIVAKFVTILLIAVCRCHYTGASDPCNENQYTPIDEYRRSIAYEIPKDHDSSDVLSDRDILKPYSAWYRFVSPAGGEMAAREDVRPRHCGTYTPLYLNGTHPTQSDGIVDRVACGDHLNTECAAQYNLQIKNCSTYYVYHLARPIGFQQAYCAGKELPCPEGYVSENGNFTPGCKAQFDDRPSSTTMVTTPLHDRPSSTTMATTPLHDRPSSTTMATTPLHVNDDGNNWLKQLSISVPVFTACTLVTSLSVISVVLIIRRRYQKPGGKGQKHPNLVV